MIPTVRRSARIAAQDEERRIAARDVFLLRARRRQAIRDSHSVVQCDHSWRGLREARGRHPDYDGQELLELDVMRVGNYQFDVCVRCFMTFVWYVDPDSGLRQYPPMEITLPDDGFVHGSMYTQVRAPPYPPNHPYHLGLGACNDWQYSAAIIEHGHWPDITLATNQSLHEDGGPHEPAGVWAAGIIYGPL